MKKILLVSCLILGFAATSHAWFWQEAPDRTATVRYRISVAANVSTAAVVVDLSDTANWPHNHITGRNNEVNISSIKVEIDKLAASSGTVKVGVVAGCDTSVGTITWVVAREFSKYSTNTDLSKPINYTPTFLRLKTTPAGTTPYVFSNDTTLASTTYQTDQVLPSVAGNTAPGRGDVVLAVTNNDTTNAIVVSVEVQYHVD